MNAPPAASLADYESRAAGVLSEAARAYFTAHAGDGITAHANRAAWNRCCLVPRVLQGVREIATGRELLGRPLPWPVLVAPIALQRLAHDDGEVATALAASALGAGMVLGSQASMAIEDVARAFDPQAAGRGPLWFQLYPLRDRGATLELVQRAERAGCSALVLTVDAGVRAARALQLPAHIRAVNLPPPREGAPSLQELLALAPSWDDVEWLRSHTQLPLLLKGVLHPADAREAAQRGVGGVIVSNHGGRVVDGVTATADALPAIVDALGGAAPVLVDGGITRGTDILKALALGADAVLVGRPVLWGLAAGGPGGAAHVLRLLHDEFLLAMAQCGVASLARIPRDLVRRDL